ncbi:MAG: DMT family transporter [Clostridia bacterium]|nr:DMT family transporter [Clostridia bacterium]
MGYIYLLLVALMFSLGGTSVRMIRPFFSPSMITLMRFVVGVFWLLMLKLVKKKRFQPDFAQAFRKHWKWLAFGAVAKMVAYSLENIGLSIGVSYGNILTQPAQMILLTVLGVLVLKEGMNAWKWTGVILCVTGILLISWNGLSVDAFLGENMPLTILYVLSGICAGLFIFAQKKVANDFDILDSNLVMFSMASLLALFVPAAQGNFLPAAVPDWKCVIAILYFGFVTGIGFYLNAKAIPLVPFQMVAILQSTMVLFSLVWGYLFFQEQITGWIISGAVLFVIGIVCVNLASNRANAK